MCLYAQFLSRSFKAVDSIRNYISGVRTLHSLLGLPFQAKDSIELKLTLKGLERLQPHKVKQAAPLSPQVMSEMHKLLDWGDTMHITMWALVLIGFFTLSRKSNLVVTGNQKFDSTKQLCRGDVSVGSKGMLVRLRWSKTNQLCKKVLEIPLLRIKGSMLCPLKAYTRMIKKIPGTNDDPAFCVPIKKGNRAVTYWELQNFIKCNVKRMGLDPTQYSSHSMRRAGATWAFQAKVPSELIKLQGDWASDAYLRYIECSTEQRMLVAQEMVARIENLKC